MATMTFKEVKELYKGEYVDVEVWQPTYGCGGYYPLSFHTDNCEGVEYIDDNELIGLWQLMDEYDYNHSICANCCVSADFDEWYGDKDAKVLCVMTLDRQPQQ